METRVLNNGDLAFTACYRECEDGPGPAVVCLHGFPDNPNSFRRQFDALNCAGYSVLAPLTRGYEPSSIPRDRDFTLASMAGDVIAWLDELGWDRVHLVGHDWGAATAYTAAALAPQRFLSLTTIAVPHPARFARQGMLGVPVQAALSWYMLFLQIPGISDYLARRNDFAFLRFLWRKWSPAYEPGAEEWRELSETFSASGVLDAMLSYYRQNVSPPILLGLKRATLNSLGQVAVPNLAITGADDGCIDTRVFDYAMLPQDYPRGFRLERIEAAGHFVHLEQPEAINPLLLDWLGSHDR
jgi:pimeloyl-ACP methyl ester carboxylesterase